MVKSLVGPHVHTLLQGKLGRDAGDAAFKLKAQALMSSYGSVTACLVTKHFNLLRGIKI